MRIITRDDIQSIGDAASLMQFLDEKLGLPIPEGLNLRQIVTDFSPYSLGLSRDIANVVLDCQEISVSPGEPSGIFLIRFGDEPDYAEIVRRVSVALDRRGRNPGDFRFICAGENYQPFAFAYFSDSAEGDWQNAELTVFSWVETKTVVHTGARHELPDVFFPVPPPPDPPVPPLVIDPTRAEALLAKLKNVGAPLGQQWTILSGNIVTGANRAFVIEEFKREQLIAQDPASVQLIRPLTRVHRKKKWVPERAYVIWIPNGRHKQWPWSSVENEAAAERIFADTYPAISNHLNRHREKLKNRSDHHQGEFYWELSVDDQNPERLPRIIYQNHSPMRACYEESDALLFHLSFFISTRDLSLLAILNSTLFKWYAQSEWTTDGTRLEFKRGIMEVFPVAKRTEAQKSALAEYVQLILDEPDSREVPALEEEIDALVYALYGLRDDEIELIEGN